MKDKILVSIKNKDGSMYRYKLYGGEYLYLEYVDKYYHVEDYRQILSDESRLVMKLAKKVGSLKDFIF